ncbi:hypothetical protein [Sphingomonas sp.]|uniref:hypothetical protein n=1 Tax=Sphingomonas sp. TaxID=28214 RepID=UPI00286E158A|nr:hypothetical protein [Sphingomonas sp.]
MKAIHVVGKLAVYYALLAAAVYAALMLFPGVRDFLPIGGVETLLSQPQRGPLEGVPVPAEKVGNLGESLVWLFTALAGALLTALPVSWVYMAIRADDEYDQSLISTILILPLVVTGIVVIVQNSLALAFSLAGIAGAVRFKNSLKSSGDALFILVAIGIGLAGGIGAVELAAVLSLMFNLCFVALWSSEYGERAGMKRYMSDFDPGEPAAASAALSPPPAPAAPPQGPAKPS